MRQVAMYEVYRNKRDRSQRMAVWPGAELPAHVNALEWELMLPSTCALDKGAEPKVGSRNSTGESEAPRADRSLQTRPKIPVL